MASSSARWRSKMSLSLPPLFRRSSTALLCAADSGPRAPSICTGVPGDRARSGTIIGTLAHPARPSAVQSSSPWIKDRCGGALILGLRADAPDGVADIVGHQQCPGPVERDADGSTVGFALGA